MASFAVTSPLNLGLRPSSTCKPRSSAKALQIKPNLTSNHVKKELFSRLPLVQKQIRVSVSRSFPSGSRNPSTVVRASATSPATVSEPWQGASLKPLLASIATGLILWFIPSPSGVSRNAWQLLAIFLATIVGIITQPLPLGAVALLGLGATVLTKTLTFAAAFSAFGDPIPWLIALAFFFARGFIKTGLGKRVAYQFVSLFGNSSLGLGYSLVFSEALLAPAIPSVSARAGGIFLPIVKSLCVACGSNVGDGTENKLGSWLMITCFQTSCISSAMFLTAMAANPLSAKLAGAVLGQPIGWTAWAVGAIVPGLVSLVVVPLILYLVYPPEVKSSPDAPRLARENLQKMGPMSKNEFIMTATLLVTVGLWIFGAMINVDAVTAAILGLSILLISGVVTWKECLSESVAWDTLTWFAALIAMANYLNKYGLITWFSETVVKFVGGLGLSWQLSFGILVLLYYYSHYFFASGAAHIGAMFTAFLSVASALGTPPLFGALVLSFLSNLMGGLTHYGIGSAPVFYGANYVPLAKWWGYGFLISVVNIAIWLGVGGFWWKTIGLW
ncbi:dicarboxylate transporter 1, chloroplastic [Amborella trichopoda]|uniref:dicarboxylate transporter 1, chloroplastic n=1 Tax=Amborella trichopoda TaxID=13333 RepID=UPI0005D456BC|nr:dicarboxylate transporter 1, chloroplastic [Amborella trichopoda]|eukprot:XP_011625484.1 dicarboxylate transporter 1, chloroplastic [Amborella trichopoda]